VRETENQKKVIFFQSHNSRNSAQTKSVYAQFIVFFFPHQFILVSLSWFNTDYFGLSGFSLGLIEGLSCSDVVINRQISGKLRHQSKNGFLMNKDNDCEI
jgi:hypothetical protein